MLKVIFIQGDGLVYVSVSKIFSAKIKFGEAGSCRLFFQFLSFAFWFCTFSFKP